MKKHRHDARRCTVTDRVTGQLVREIRKSKNMTQKDLASLLGFSIQQIQKYEHARNRIPFGRLRDIIKILDIDIHDFMDRLDAKISHHQD